MDGEYNLCSQGFNFCTAHFSTMAEIWVGLSATCRRGADANRPTFASTTKADVETEAAVHLTTEEWNKINDLLSYRPEEESSALSSPEAPNMLQTELEVSIGRSGAEVLDQNEVQILCGRFEDLQVSLLRYPKSEKCDVKLKFYGLSAPEGGLIEVDYQLWTRKTLCLNKSNELKYLSYF